MHIRNTHERNANTHTRQVAAKPKSNWEVVTDESGDTYYYNTVTQQSQWDKPADFSAPSTKKVPMRQKSPWEKVVDGE
eukprot:1368370-Amorphochlora_amoeboformis.AAC.1